MSDRPEPLAGPAPFFWRAILALTGLALVHCSSSSGPHGSGSADGGGCFADSDGINGGSYTIDLTVDDTGFSKTVLNTENDATITLTLMNAGTKSHGFEVGCTSVLSQYPNLPAMCPSMSCFPQNSTIAPIPPGSSKTITFFTPTADNLIYPFMSSEPSDSAVAGLNNGQWSLM
jgi:hypothetical protein